MDVTSTAAATDGRARGSGDMHELLLATTEKLLEQRPLHALSVANIIEAAGVSRTSFYFYFSSKNAVVGACMKRVIDDVFVAIDPFLAKGAKDPEAAIRASLEGWLGVCRDHGPLLRAVMDDWPRDAELRALWFTFVEGVTRQVADVIRADRRAGIAPPGCDPLALAASLMWCFERSMHVALSGGAAGLPDPEAVVDPLVQVLIGSVYGRPPAAKR